MSSVGILSDKTNETSSSANDSVSDQKQSNTDVRFGNDLFSTTFHHLHDYQSQHNRLRFPNVKVGWNLLFPYSKSVFKDSNKASILDEIHAPNRQTSIQFETQLSKICQMLSQQLQNSNSNSNSNHNYSHNNNNNSTNSNNNNNNVNNNNKSTNLNTTSSIRSFLNGNSNYSNCNTNTSLDKDSKNELISMYNQFAKLYEMRICDQMLVDYDAGNNKDFSRGANISPNISNDGSSNSNCNNCNNSNNCNSTSARNINIDSESDKSSGRGIRNKKYKAKLLTGHCKRIGFYVKNYSQNSDNSNFNGGGGYDSVINNGHLKCLVWYVDNSAFTQEPLRYFGIKIGTFRYESRCWLLADEIPYIRWINDETLDFKDISLNVMLIVGIALLNMKINDPIVKNEFISPLFAEYPQFTQTFDICRMLPPFDDLS